MSGNRRFFRAESRTAVAGERVSVITSFREAADAVAAAGAGTIAVAKRGGRVGILCTVITFLSGVDATVAAGVGKQPAGAGIAAVGKSGVVQRRLADFIQCALHDAIAAESAFEETGRGAAIAVAGVIVVAFLGWFEDAVAAEERGSSAMTGCGRSDRGERLACPSLARRARRTITA